MHRIVRWSLLLGLIAVIALAACQNAQGPATPPAAEKKLTIFSWWTAGGEADGLNALIALFKQQNPDVEIVNAAVAGGAGTNAKAVLKTRMLGGDPPDTFQVHGGAELIDTWVKAGYMEPIAPAGSPLAEALTHFPAGLVGMVSYEGQVYAVPANVHRGNVLYYNKAILAKFDAAPPATYDEWIALAKKMKAAGQTTLAIASRNKWEVTHLFEDLLVVAGGPAFYNDLFAGKVAWTDERVKKALGMLAELLDYANEDHAALTWDQACAYVQQGKAAMTVMGDWAKGYFLAQNLKPEVDYDAVPTPGTAGVFFVITDTFGLPKGAPHADLTRKFLEVIASVEGQAKFNPPKGSIPARTDVPPDGFDVLARRTMADFAKDTLVPSATHGSAVVEAFVTGLNDQLSVFISDRDVNKTAEALQLAARDAGVIE